MADLIRCPWAGSDPLYLDYHDREWGKPVHSDKIHFEFLVLESAQAGLSWLTVLRKRERYRKVYLDFDPVKVARFSKSDIEGLLSDPGIVRNRKKIEASVGNAHGFLDICSQFGSFDGYLWNYVDGRPVVGGWRSMDQIPATTDLSDRISADLKKRGFRFIGSTIIYSHLQAVGIVNDHVTGCFRYKELKRQT